MSNSQDKNESSVIKYFGESDRRRAFIAGEELKVSGTDSGDYRVFDVNELHLRKIYGSDLLESLILRLNDEHTISKFELIKGIEFYRCEQAHLSLEIFFYNKFWEGFYGLTTLLKAIIEQVHNQENFSVIDTELDDSHKHLIIRYRLPEEELLIDSIHSVVEQFNNLLFQAEKTLTLQRMKQFQEEE
jgi:hypothetical protein